MLGEHNRGVEEGTEKIVDVVEIIVHERYNRSITDNDITLMRLAEDVQYTRSIKPICIPRDDVTDNMMCITAGWGHTLCELTPHSCVFPAFLPHSRPVNATMASHARLITSLCCAI